MADPTIPDAALSAIKAVHTAMTTDGIRLTPNSAWNLVYRYILDLHNGLPHIVESNDLNRGGRWERAARAVSEWMRQPGRLAAQELAVQEANDRLGAIHRPGAIQKQAAKRGQNLTGFAFEHALGYLINELCGFWPPVRRSIRKVRGYEIVSKSEVDELDLIVISEADFRLFVSCVWTSRGDRVTADIYDAGFVRRRRPDVQTAVVTNEFKLHILEDLIGANEIDAVYHVCKEALLEAHRPEQEGLTVAEALRGSKSDQFRNFMRLNTEVKDLSELFSDVDAIVQTSKERAED